MATRTVLHERHVARAARMVEFSGWQLPVQYEGVLAEHKHCRSHAVIFDTSHMGQFLIRGAAAGSQLAQVCTQNAPMLEVGRCRYGFLLNEDAGVIDDTILMRLGGDEFLLVVNAGTQAGDWEWLGAHLDATVERINLCAADGWGKIDLQGPQSFEALRPLSEPSAQSGASDRDILSSLRYFSVARLRVAGRECIVSRTGYTGELGYEIMAPGDSLCAIFDALKAHPMVKPAGLGARDSLRLEMCLPLYGHELDLEHNPIEAGLEPFVPLKHDFIGARRLREIQAAGPRRRLIAFKSGSRRRCNSGDAIVLEGRPIGTVTSGAFSPSLEVSIGMGYVDAACAATAKRLIIDTGRAELDVEISQRPLYRRGTCRANVIPTL